MVWMLIDLVIDLRAVAMLLSKALLGAVVGYFFKRVWRAVMPESKKCAVERCMRQATAATRGMCLICYGKAKKKVEDGEVTWQTLEELGMCGKPSDPFDDAYSRAMENR